MPFGAGARATRAGGLGGCGYYIKNMISGGWGGGGQYDMVLGGEQGGIIFWGEGQDGMASGEVEYGNILR